MNLSQLIVLLSVLCALGSECMCQTPDAEARQAATDGLICKYVTVHPKRQIVVSFNGQIRFLDPENLQLPEMGAHADIVRRTPKILTMKIVMIGRTDVFFVDLQTLKGYQQLLQDDGSSVKYPLTCSH